MRPVKDETLSELEETAVASAKAIRVYLAYQGSEKKYEQKARVAAAAISSAVEIPGVGCVGVGEASRILGIDPRTVKGRYPTIRHTTV